MKKLTIKCILPLVAALAFAACDTDVEHDIPQVNAPVFVSSVPADGATDVKHGSTTITVKYDKNVFFATSNLSAITLTGDGGTIVGANVYGSNTDLVIDVRLERGKTYSINIPEGVVLGPNKMPAAAVNLQFATANIVPSLVNASATAVTQKVYNYLVEAYGGKMLSGAMANVNWNTEEADRVHTLTGKYPAINTFDYVHLPFSPANWIDYSDISPVKNWWTAGGLVSIMWHWNVPAEEGSDEYAFYKEETTFDAANATASGTWENEVFTADLAKVATSLKQLQSENIAVIWRPFHEAAGGWFWWGKDADSQKELWVAMFDYFKAEGVNNLIWVWTTETGDADWYPGDSYVDIIGRDLYDKDAATAAGQYQTIDDVYSTKLIGLTECGTVGLISEQWTAGARWSWFMPWYDNANAETPHASDAWWTDAMSQSFVVTRDQLPGF
ncbi:beta-mannosidase [Bacteroides sp. 51]|nr:glycosyl hydrolase [Bacteroides sp. 51]NDV83160.1 beta-mannosidase [Bacteroides sp. 51]